MAELRVCKACGDPKPLTKTNFKPTPKGYFARVCRKCEAKKYWPKVKDRHNAAKRKWIQAHPEVGIFRNARRFDRDCGFEFDLTVEFIRSAISEPCRYCGETELLMTLDRIDNGKGHTTSNVVPACVRCNYLRRDMPYEAWLYLVPSVREARVRGLFGEWTGRARLARVVEQEDTPKDPCGPGAGKHGGSTPPASTD